MLDFCYSGPVADAPMRALRMKAVENPRAAPRQRRAQASVDAVLEAAIQVLERHGEGGFNTNAIAERAGVSVGTLYRYFPDKGAILLALAQREMQAVNAAMAELAASRDGPARDRAMIRTFLQAFDGRSRARRTAVAAFLAKADPKTLAAGHDAVDGAFVDAAGQPLSRIRAFVLSRAVQGPCAPR
jgi:AcrR family transcriptional regulator